MIIKLCTQKTACKMQTNASQNLQCNFISHNNQMNALCMHFACIWSIVFQRVAKFQVPKSVKKLQRFLGMANYYHRFIPKCATISAPLHKLLNKGEEFNWTYDHTFAFEKLKSVLQECTLLCFLYDSKDISLTTDASNSGMWAVLEEYNKDTSSWEPLAFFSKTFNQAQSKYSTFNRELFAIKSAIKHFLHLLEGRHFTVYTDHKPLTYISTQINLDWSALQSCLGDKITQSTTDIRYLKGQQNPVADSLSGIMEVKASFLVWKELSDSQINDEDCISGPVNFPALKLKWISGDDFKILCDTTQENS